MEKPLISVIVPVYNVEEYLNRCVDSVINQTYHNLEILLVDDGSCDRSGTMCDEYAEKDDRIIVIHKANGGLSDARNAAIDIMKGEYVSFVDGDDFLANDYIEYMYSMLTEYDADISTCNLKPIYDFAEQLDLCKEKESVYEPCDALRDILRGGGFLPSACCKLYKREIFAEIRYPKGMYYEDLAVISKVLDKCKRIVVGKQQKYYYYQRSNSIMNGIFNPKKMHRIQIVNELKEYVNEKYPVLNKEMCVRCFKVGTQVYREIPYKREYKEYIDIAWEQIRKYRWETLKNGEAAFSLRVVALSTYLGKSALAFLGHLYSIVFKQL